MAGKDSSAVKKRSPVVDEMEERINPSRTMVDRASKNPSQSGEADTSYAETFRKLLGTVDLDVKLGY